MMAGHFGLAAAVKSKQPRLPLWSLMLATQLLDILFVPLLVLGVESIEVLPGKALGPANYGAALIQADYTHSLEGALIITIVAGIIASRWWGRPAAKVFGAVVFSHWLLDLLVHRADMPILSGNAGNLPLLDLGLWHAPVATLIIEAALILVGTALYARAALSLPALPGESPDVIHKRAITAAGVTSTIMALALVGDVFIGG